jgi:hypothetical protein
MTDVLTMAQIEAWFPNQWVLIGELRTDARLHILSGRVLFHSKGRDEAHQKLLELPGGHLAILYNGSPPPDMAFALSVWHEN